MAKRKPTPICPNCGSVDMAVFKKHAVCNRCRKSCVRYAAFVHAHRPEGQGQFLSPPRWRNPIDLLPGGRKDNS
jgi:hypothetical protein